MKILDAIIQYGILAFVFLIPWQARLIIQKGAINGGYWEYGTRSLYATEVLLLLILLAVIVKGGIYVFRTRPRFSLKRINVPAGGLFIALLWAGISIFWGVDGGVAFERWLMLVSAGAVFLIIASGAVPFRHLSWAIILSGSIQAVLAFIQFRWQWLPASTWLGMAYQHASMLGASVVETDMARWLRGYGSFPHPNMLGGWLVLGLLLALKEAKRTPLAYIPIALMSVGLAVTFSRGAWLAAAIGLAIWLVAAWTAKPASTLSPKKVPGNFLPIFVMLIFAGTVVAAYPEPFNERIFGSGRLEEKSIQERSGGISESLSLIKQHPIAGVGMGNYGLAVHRDIDANQPAYYYQPVHNVPLLILAELGIIGLVLMLTFFLSFFYRHPERSEPQASGVEGSRWLSAGVFLLPLITIALFDHYLWSLYSGVMISALYLAIFIRSAHQH